MKSNLPEAARKRQGLFLLFLPVFLVPILWLLIGNAQPASAHEDVETKGMNLELPSPNLERKQASKSDAYQALQKEEKRQDNWNLPDFLVQSRTEASQDRARNGLSSSPAGFSSYTQTSSPSTSFQAMEVDRRIKELETLIEGQGDLRNSGISGTSGNSGILEKAENPVEILPQTVEGIRREEDPELIQLQGMMDRLQAGKGQPDPELVQLEGLMDKILQLQYPDRFPIENTSLDSELIPIPVGDPSIPDSDSYNEGELGMASELSNGFFGLEEPRNGEHPQLSGYKKTYLAAVAKTQEIVPGDALELVLEEKLIVGGNILAAGTPLFAKTSLEGSRLQVQVLGILQDGVLLPVSLKGYSQDGVPGIALSAMKGASQWIQNTGQSLQSMNINSTGMDWQSQVANSGIQATRSLLRNPSKMRKMEIKAGHPVLLIDSSSSTSKTQVL
ncbi:conjugative transposon protein TraM [Algoriphagus namhaensis]